MPARTIGFLSPLYFDDASCVGGGERYPRNLARGVAEGQGGRWRVELISFGPESWHTPITEGVTLRVLKAAGRPQNPMDVVSWEMPEAIAASDLLHIHQPFTRCGELGLLVAKQQRKPVCVTDHGGISSRLGEELGLLELADRVVAYSAFGAALYRTSTPIVTIPGGVDCDAFRPPASPPRREHVLYVGRLLPHKGIDRLIEALPPELPLKVCGRAYHDGYYHRLRALAAGKAVEFITDADDAGILELYRRAWATVLPSVYRDCYGVTYPMPELMGLTLLESMACGTPAIASRVGAMPEFVVEGRTGFVFDTPAELAGSLRRLASEPGLAARMGQEARADMLARFDLRIAGAGLRGVYESLISEAKGAAA
jgi:glycosyltransferase involved in cell wall biosynthesis